MATIRRKALAAVLAAVLLLTSGCWEYRMLNTIALALALAVDSDGEGGYLLTLQFPLPGLMKGGGQPSADKEASTGAGQFFVVQGRGKSFPEALNDVQRMVSRPMSFGHMQVVLLSEELLTQGAVELFEQLWRFPELDKLAYVLMVRGSDAAEALRVVPPQERLPARYLTTAMEAMSQSSTVARPSTLLQSLLFDREPGRDFLVTVVTVQGRNMVIDRVAVVRDSRLVTLLTINESRAVLFALGEAANGTLTLERPAGGTWVYRRLASHRARLSVQERPGGPLLGVYVRVGGEVAGASGGGLALPDAELAAMERALEERMSRDIRATLERLQAEGVEPLGFYARRYPHMENDRQWRQAYSKARFDVRIEASLQRKGVLE